MDTLNCLLLHLDFVIAHLHRLRMFFTRRRAIKAAITSLSSIAILSLTGSRARAAGSWQSLGKSSSRAQGSWQAATKGSTGLGSSGAGNQGWESGKLGQSAGDGPVIPGSYQWRMQQQALDAVEAESSFFKNLGK